MAEKYVLEKEGKASVRTDSESVKVRYLADGFTLKGKPAAIKKAPAKKRATKKTASNKPAAPPTSDPSKK